MLFSIFWLKFLALEKSNAKPKCKLKAQEYSKNNTQTQFSVPKQFTIVSQDRLEIQASTSTLTSASALQKFYFAFQSFNFCLLKFIVKLNIHQEVFFKYTCRYTCSLPARFQLLSVAVFLQRTRQRLLLKKGTPPQTLPQEF